VNKTIIEAREMRASDATIRRPIGLGITRGRIGDRSVSGFDVGK
jgi:hypothetical protein